MQQRMAQMLRKTTVVPEWYPLDIYGKDLTAVEWHDALFQRLVLQTVLGNTGDKEKVRTLFEDVLVNNNSLKINFFEDVKPPGELWGISSLSAYELAYLAAMMLDCKKGRALVERVQLARRNRDIESLIVEDNSTIQDSNREEFGDYVDWDNEPFDVRDVLPRFPLSVDLDQDDETLELSFKIYLAGVRDPSGPTRKAFGDRDFSDWKRYGVLPVFDLQLWAKLNDSRYTDSVLARTIWPHEDIDVTERMRKVARPRVRMLLSDWSAISRLRRQIELVKSLDTLIEERNLDNSE